MKRLTDTGGLDVEIVSLFAAIAGGTPHGLSWCGHVPREMLNGLTDTSVENANHVNEALFRAFNRVDPSDDERLERIHYRLPSLSPGDLIAWSGCTYRVLAIGFERLEPTAAFLATLRHRSLGEPAPSLSVLIGEYAAGHPEPARALAVALVALARQCRDMKVDPATVPVLETLGIDRALLRGAFQ